MATNSWQRFFGLFIPLAFLIGIFAIPAAAGGSRHPYFNDQGTLEWYHSFAEAKRVAQRDQKLIFVEYGRRACSNCRSLAQNVLPNRSIRGRISNLAIGLASNCDRPEREIAVMFQRNLRNARMLPFVAFITPRGRWITGWAGHSSVSIVQRHLALAEARHRSIFGSSRERASRSPAKRQKTRILKKAPAPQAAPAPAPAPVPYPQPDEDPCASQGECVGGNCAPPRFDECVGGNCAPPRFEDFRLPGLPSLGEIFKPQCCPPKACPPKAPTDCRPCPPQPCTPVPEAGAATMAKAVPRTECDFPLPQERIEQPERQLAEAAPEPSTPVLVDAARVATGSPDAESVTQPETVQPQTERHIAIGSPDGATPARRLPPPAIRRARAAPARLASGEAITVASAAAARGDWAEVLHHTRGATNDEPRLFSLNRQAHDWAHSQLASAVKDVRAQRYDNARVVVAEVSRKMNGEAESVDADRGAEAIELMRDLEYLAEGSAVRTSVRKTAYERMRGSRWAPLFSDVPTASAALSSR